MEIHRDLIDLFRSRTIPEPNTGCLLWTETIRSNGYGAITFKNKPILSHRLSWQISFGQIPKGVSVLHKCDVRACVNPDHLFLGTQKDNILDMMFKNRFPSANILKCKNGHTLNAENTYFRKDQGNGKRICKVCRKLRARIYRKTSVNQ